MPTGFAHKVFLCEFLFVKIVNMQLTARQYVSNTLDPSYSPKQALYRPQPSALRRGRNSLRELIQEPGL